MYKRIFVLIIIIGNSLIYGHCQNALNDSIAKINFEIFFASFKSFYPEDEFEYSFDNYSELDSLIIIPETLKIFQRIDSVEDIDWYINVLGGTINRVVPEIMGKVDILELDLPSEIKDKFESILILFEGEYLKSESDREKLVKLVKEMAEMTKRIDPIFVGYEQVVEFYSENKEGVEKNGKIMIKYNKELLVTDFGLIR